MASRQDPRRVPAAEFIRDFANWRMQAAREPVVVTHHGKDAHVLISLDDYRKLDGREAGTVDALRDSQSALLDAVRDAVLVVDRQARIVAVNPAASDMLERAASALIGSSLSAAVAGLEGSLLFPHVVRMLDHRQRFSGEVPGLLRPRQWLRADLIPLPVGGALILRDVSEGIGDLAERDALRALATAIDADGGVGHARISVREAIETANPALAAMVGVDEAAMRRVRFSALLALGARHAFAEALEDLFRSGAPARIASELVTREGGALPVTLSIAERRGAYASDGALILVTRR